jgi:hypothetical protein
MVLIGNSCTSNLKYDKGGLFTSDKTITIPLGSSISKIWRNTQYIDSLDHETLVFYDNTKSDPKEILFYDLGAKTFSESILIDLEGPNGVGDLHGFYVQSYDSIYVINKYQYRVFLLNRKGKIQQTYFLLNQNKEKERKYTMLPWNESRLPMHHYNNILYIPGISDTHPVEFNYRLPLNLIRLDLTTGEYSYHLRHPKSYDKEYWDLQNYVPSFTFNQDSFAMIFPIDDHIFKGSVLSLSLPELNMIKVPSGSIKTFNPVEPPYNDIQHRTRSQLGSDHFHSILYDRYRKLYYRLEVMKYNQESINRILNYQKGDPSRSFITVLDEELNILMNTELPLGVYNIKRSFVTKDGLAIQKQTEQEDEQVFDVFVY